MKRVSDTSELSLERRGTTVIATLDRAAKMNALSASLVEELLAAVSAAYDDGTRLFVLRGEGKNLSAGFDMGGYETQGEGDLALRFIRIEQLLQVLRYAPFDTLALAHGRNFGAGADLFCACARRVATVDATFRMPGLRFGIVLGTRTLADRVGPDRARALLQDAATFGGDEAFEWGFLTAIAEQATWPAIIEAAGTAAETLSPDAAQALYRATNPDHRDADLADLARSAAEPGLKMRIAAYLMKR